MAAISALITELRTDLNDDDSTRWTDTKLLNMFKKTIRRANRICQRNAINFAKKSVALATVANQAYVDISSTVSDFDVWSGLFRDDTHAEIIKKDEKEWETIYFASLLTFCRLDQAGAKIYFNGTPDSVVALTLWYYPKVDPSAYTVDSTTPWGGRLDDILMEYVGIRAKNIDEMDVSYDLKLMADMESQILAAYLPNTQQVSEGRGWL
jgi:hypothetical protein